MLEDCFCENIKSVFEKQMPNTPVFVYEFIDSTNNEAKKIAMSENGFKNAFFIAKKQTAGRGRKGRNFISDEGGLYISYLMHPDLLPKDAIKLTLFAAVCLCEVIEEMTNLSPSIKWVNDILIDEKKVAGILTEGSFDEKLEKFEYAIVGIGVNLRKVNFPSELSKIASDIETISGKSPDIYEFALKLASKLQNFENSETSDYMHEYRRRSVALGKIVKVISADEEYFAEAISIDEDGSLIVVSKGNEQKCLISGEISIKL